MDNLNTWMGEGNLTRDVEVKKFDNGGALAKFCLAVGYSKNKENKETLFLECEAPFGAEALEKYGKKGKNVFVQGQLRQDSWKDKEGNNRSKVLCRVEKFKFIGARDVEVTQDKPSKKEDKKETKTTKEVDVPF